MEALNRNDYKLFTNSDFSNIIGKNLNDILANENSGNNSEYLITYVSTFVQNYILKCTGRKLYKVYNQATPDDFTLRLGFTNDYYVDSNGNRVYSSMLLSDEQVRAIKLACVYQADYVIENGSPERMSGLAISSRTAVLSKNDLVSYELCSISRELLVGSGILYAGIGVGTNAWIK